MNFIHNGNETRIYSNFSDIKLHNGSQLYDGTLTLCWKMFQRYKPYKLYNNKYMMTSAQIINTEIFAFVTGLFKSYIKVIEP